MAISQGIDVREGGGAKEIIPGKTVSAPRMAHIYRVKVPSSDVGSSC